MLTEKAEKWLEARGLDPEVASRLGVESCDRHGGEWLSIPYVRQGEAVNHKFRSLNGKSWHQEAGSVQCLWNEDVLRDATLTDPVVITEGEFDALAAIQSGYLRTVSVPGGAPAAEGTAKHAYLDGARELLQGVNEVVLAFDADGPGANLLHDLSHILGRARCKWVPYPRGCKDLNETLQKYGQRGVDEAFKRASWVRVDGVFKLSELPPLPDITAYQTGIPWLQEHYRIRWGDFCVITGIPSHGKTVFANHLAASVAETHGWRVAFASFEQAPQKDHRRALRTLFHKKRECEQSPEERAEADAWIDERFCFLVPSEDDEVTLDWVLERMAVAVHRFGCKLLIIDPWNELDHRRPFDTSLTEYVGEAIKALKRFARKHLVHLIVVAHPVKQKKTDDGTYQMPTLYDISDSAHWYNKADVGIVVHRKDQSVTSVRVVKSRYHEEIGVPGEIAVFFNPHTGRFEERS